MSQILAGKVALVVGAGRGFGRVIAESLASAGARVALAGRSMDQLNNVAGGIQRAGGEALVIAADATDPTAATAAVDRVQAHFGRLDILVNNAGMAGPYGPIGDVNNEDWWYAQTLHVRGPMLFMAAVIPLMREAGGGCIINVASRAGTRLEPNLSAYSVGKATLINLTRHVAAEQAGNHIKVFAIQPGDAVTEMAKTTLTDPEAQKWMPGMLEVLKEWVQAAPDPQPVLANCGAFCVALAAGDLDEKSGEYLDAEHDWSPSQ